MIKRALQTWWHRLRSADHRSCAVSARQMRRVSGGRRSGPVDAGVRVRNLARTLDLQVYHGRDGGNQEPARLHAAVAGALTASGSPIPIRSVSDVRHVVAAYADVLALPTLVRRETFNVASGNLVAVGELLDRLLAMSRVEVTVEQDPERTRSSDVPSAAIDASRLRAQAGWAPRRTLDQTIADVLDYHGRQGA